jgi:hypothetical protein
MIETVAIETAVTMSALAHIQLEDARRAVSCAASALACVLADADAESMVGSECTEMRLDLVRIGNALADLTHRARVRP